MILQEAKDEMMRTSLTMRIENDSIGNPVYVGYALPGSLESEPKWQIRKIEYDTNGNVIAVKFANGEPTFDKVWDDRASYTYS